MNRLWWAGAILATSLAMAVWIGPYALSSYHLEAGGRALDAALMPVSPDWLTPEQIVDAERLEAGVAHLHRAIRWDPRNVQAMRLLVRVYVTRGQSEAALEMLQQALAVRPDNPLLYLELGDVYDSLGQTEAAIEAYETGGIGSRGVPLAVNYLKLADAHAQAGSGDVAIELWRKAAIVNPDNLYALYRLAQIHREMGDEERAAEYEERLRYFDLNAVAISPDARMAEYQGQAMAALVGEGIWERDTLLNVVSYQVWQFAEGAPGVMTERVLGVLLERMPEDVDILFYLAEPYHRRGDWEQAEAAYKQVLEVEPEYAQAYLRLGMVSESASERVGESASQRLGEAAGWYERYYEMAPEDLLGLKKLTEVYEALGQPGAARLREELEARTDDQRIVAELLGVSVEDVELGPNLVENGGFEEWVDGRPEWWKWSNMATGNPRNRGTFLGGQDMLTSWEGGAALVNGLWVQRFQEREPGRAGFWQVDEDDNRKSLRSIALNPYAPYILSFCYCTEGAYEDTAAVWVSPDAQVMFQGDHWSPDTDGNWWRFVAVGWNRLDVEAAVRPLLRSFGPGQVWFDQVELRAIYLHSDAQLAQTRFTVLRGDGKQ